MEYKYIKKNLDDKKLYEKTITLLNARINHKIESRLGLKGMTFEEVKVQCSKTPDKFIDLMGEIEELDKLRKSILDEIKLIDDYLDDIDKSVSKMNDREKLVFKYRYVYGLSQKDIVNKGIASERTIRDTLNQIKENLKLNKGENK